MPSKRRGRKSSNKNKVTNASTPTPASSSAAPPRSTKRLLRSGQSLKWRILRIVVIAGIAFGYKRFSRSSGTCKNPSDPSCPDKYFSKSYLESRHRFLELSSNLEGSNRYHFPVYTTPEGLELTTDFTILNEESTSSDHVIIHLSGTHGPEGYAGSAIQLALLEHMSNMERGRLLDPLLANYTFEYGEKDSPIVIFVHAVNPYGFHYTRRVNEHNVDLNRNFKSADEWQTFKERSFEQDVFGYKPLFDFFNPKYDLPGVIEWTDKLPSSLFMRGVWLAGYYWMEVAKHLFYRTTVGESSIGTAFMNGQMFDSEGIQYVGESGMLEQSHVVLRDFLTDWFEEEHPEWRSQIKKISYVDVHTALGQYGKDWLFTKTAKERDVLKELIPKHAAQNLIADMETLLGGAYKNITGPVLNHLDNLIGQVFDGDEKAELDTLGVVQEFGTYDNLWVFSAMRFENAVTNACNKVLRETPEKSKLVEKCRGLLNDARRRYRNVFYVESVDWKTQIVTRGVSLFTHLFER